MHIKIDKPKKEDINEICKLFEIVIRDTFKKEEVHDILEIKNEIKDKEKMIKKSFDDKNTNFLIAKIDGKIIGSIGFGKANEIIKKNVKEDIPEVTSVYVHPDYQRQGIGSILFKSILKLMLVKKIKKFCLDSGFKLAQGFWKHKLGNPTISLKDYWGERYDHMIWCMDVKNALEIV